MRRLAISILALLCAFPALPSSKLAHAEPSQTLYTCLSPDSPFGGQEIIVRYDAPDAELSLVSNNTGETVQVLENGLNTPQFEVRGWSSDCRYMIASLGIWGEQQTAAWDVVENRRVGTLETQGQRYEPLIWIPTHDNRLLIESLTGAWLWHLPTNMQSRMNPYSNENGRNFEYAGYTPYVLRQSPRHLAWDLERNQLLAVPVDPNRDGVAAYDLFTGQEVAFFALNPTARAVRYRLFDNNHHLLIFAADSPISRESQLVLYNRDTGSALPLSPAGLDSASPLVVFSPSHRYLIIETWNIYVWDLQNLDATTPPLPNQKLEIWLGSTVGARINGVRMNADETIVQAVDMGYGRSFTIWQWDLATGEEFYSKGFFKTVCDDLSQLAPEDDVELVTWACSYR